MTSKHFISVMLEVAAAFYKVSSFNLYIQLLFMIALIIVAEKVQEKKHRLFKTIIGIHK